MALTMAMPIIAGKATITTRLSASARPAHQPSAPRIVYKMPMTTGRGNVAYTGFY
jgi:hypothetical protein